MSRSHLAILASALALSTALFWLGEQTAVTNHASPEVEVATTATPIAHRASSVAAKTAMPKPATPSDEELLPIPEDLSDLDVANLPAGTIAFERFTLDDLRKEQNLPAIDQALIDMNNYPMEQPHQAQDPVLHAFYEIDRDLYRAKHLARHKVVERNRFWARAQSETDPETKTLLLNSAKYHARLALGQQRLQGRLLAKREQLATEVRASLAP